MLQDRKQGINNMANGDYMLKDDNAKLYSQKPVFSVQ